MNYPRPDNSPDELVIPPEEVRETQSAMAAAAYVLLSGIAMWLGAILALLVWALA